MPINLERRAIVGLGLLWLSGVRASAAVDATGLWSSVARTGKGGVSGAQMIVTATNVVLTDGILTDAAYKIDGNKLTMTAVDARHGPPEVCDFDLDGDTLTITPTTSEDTRPRVMTRAGAPHPGADPIVGEWTWPFLGDWNCVQRFSRHGATQFALPLEVREGHYRLVGDKMHIELPQKKSLTLTVRREGNFLMTHAAGAKEIKYARFEY